MTLNEELAIGLEAKLSLHKPLTVKLGFDPTSPDLHLGHFVVLRGAKKLQDLGHNITIIIGDYTASIGDPSGRNKLRPSLSPQEIAHNAKTYMEQVFLVLDQAKTTVLHNSSWLGAMSMGDMLQLLSSFTLAQVLARDDFKNRFSSDTPIFMHELTYPLMQGMDSVAIKADIELGGTDQTFNLMMGRILQKSKGHPEQAVITFPLLVGLDGKNKMSKSLKNHIALMDSPTEKFGKIMSIADGTMAEYWRVLFDKTDAEIIDINSMHSNPRDAKLVLASEIVSIFHGIECATTERENFIDQFSNKVIADSAPINFNIPGDTISLGHLIKALDLAKSVSEAGRKISQSGVKVNHVVVHDKTHSFSKNEQFLLQVGKLHSRHVKIS
jgi:tyrosyl-tRNA synthetase